MTPASLGGWVLRRCLLALPVVVGITTLTFVLIHVVPGDPVYLLAGDGGSPSYYADMRARYGLDRPLAEQFVRYLALMAQGDLGYSFMYQAPVAQVIVQHAPASIVLGATSLTLATVAGFLIGTWCGALGSRAIDRLMRVWASAAYAAPVFWTGQAFTIVLSVQLGLLPVAGLSSARDATAGFAYLLDLGRHLILPALTSALPLMAVVARVSRAALLETMHEPFIRAADARGFTRTRVVAGHAAPNALVPVIALVGQHATTIVAGAALTEALFAWPGLGYLVLHATQHRDYPLVTASFIVISVSVVVFSAIADALCAWLDPRIRLT
jgi:peptide/nickel transport system permease protein